jgi:hypothetical protein
LALEKGSRRGFDADDQKVKCSRQPIRVFRFGVLGG